MPKKSMKIFVYVMLIAIVGASLLAFIEPLAFR